MRVEDGRVRLAGKWVQVVPEHVAAALTSATRWLTAAGQAAAAELSESDLAPGPRPGRVVVRRAAQRRILAAADAAWRAAGHGAMPAAWADTALAGRVRQMLDRAGDLGRWGDELRWWLRPYDGVTPELAVRIAAVLAAVRSGADATVVAAAEARQRAAEAWRIARAQARRQAAEAVGPEPAATPEEAEAIRLAGCATVPPEPRREDYRPRVAGGRYLAVWNGQAWRAWRYREVERVEYSTYHHGESSRAGSGEHVEEYRWTEAVPTEPAPDDEQAAAAAEAEALYERWSATRSEARHTEMRRQAARDAYRARVAEYRRRRDAAADEAERQVTAPCIIDPAEVLLAAAGLGSEA